LLRKKDVEVVKNGEFCLVSREKKSFVDIELLDGGVDATTTVAAAALGR